MFLCNFLLLIICYSNTYNYATSGVIYSTGWPSSYMKSYSSCEYRISRSYGYQGVYVAFMDIHLRRSQWDFIDCLRVRGKFGVHHKILNEAEYMLLRLH